MTDELDFTESYPGSDRRYVTCSDRRCACICHQVIPYDEDANAIQDSWSDDA